MNLQSFLKVILISFQCFIQIFSNEHSINCNNPFKSYDVRVTGDWPIDTGSQSVWNGAEPNGLMIFNEDKCIYYKIIKNLKKNHQYKWKVTINNGWNHNYGCDGPNGPDCFLRTDPNGSIRFVMQLNTNPPKLSTDYENDYQTTTTSEISTTSINCNNNFNSKVVRATGDWLIDAGSNLNWKADESKGLMSFNDEECVYILVLTRLKHNFQYSWKVVIDNSWINNYGCVGLSGPNCVFKTNNDGAIRLIFDQNKNPPILKNDQKFDQKSICGNGICEPGETCVNCEIDCGPCPTSICGDGKCDPGETFLTCPEDCPNELPNCDRFNDEICKDGNSFKANPGVEKRRWQTPKPNSNKYQPSFQYYYALVGYANIQYTNKDRNEADVCIIATHKESSNVKLKYIFNGVEQDEKCKRFTSTFKESVSLKVTGSDSTELVLPSIDLLWNVKILKDRFKDAQIYRNGQKGAVVELFGWPHTDITKECELIGKAGYLGVKLFPVHEQLMSTQPFKDALNPWYFMYQPVSYKLEGRMGNREQLKELINRCRSQGVRVYGDAVLNHFTGGGNDLNDHRNPNAGCTKWSNKTSSASIDRQSPFYTHSFTYKYNPNTGQPPSNEFPGAAIGPEDFHCERALNSWNDIFILNNGWLVGLTDVDTSKDNVRERQAAYIVEMISMGFTGFRIDAAKHISIEDLTAIFKKIQIKLGGQFPDDFFLWLEVLTGGESQLLWQNPGWYGPKFEQLLLQHLGSISEVNKIKIWDGLYPKEPNNNPSISRHRIVIQNDDHDQQTPGSSSRDMATFGCVLVRGCPIDQHREYEIKLFQNPYYVNDNSNDWPIRFILSSYYHKYGSFGIPDGFSDCKLCTIDCNTCKESVPYEPAFIPGKCAYNSGVYTKVHRDVRIINEMRKWMGLNPIAGSDIGLRGCF